MFLSHIVDNTGYNAKTLIRFIVQVREEGVFVSVYEKLDDIVEINNGYLCTSEEEKQGVSRNCLANYVHEHNMQHIAHGVYMSEDAWYDEMYIIHLRNKKAVFSHESALYLHTLIDKEPSNITITVPSGYNATHLRKHNYKIFTVAPEIYTIGIVEKETIFGNKVRVYDIDRTICDVIKNKKYFEIHTFQTALKEYMRSNEHNLFNLMQYAQSLKITNKVKIYTDVML